MLISLVLFKCSFLLQYILQWHYVLWVWLSNWLLQVLGCYLNCIGFLDCSYWSGVFKWKQNLPSQSQLTLSPLHLFLSLCFVFLPSFPPFLFSTYIVFQEKLEYCIKLLNLCLAIDFKVGCRSTTALKIYYYKI